jgi:hypothetical protein
MRCRYKALEHLEVPNTWNGSENTDLFPLSYAINFPLPFQEKKGMAS